MKKPFPVSRGNKFRATKTEYISPLVGKRLYDSKAEAARAAVLDIHIRNDEIAYWLPQVPFPLPGGQKYRVDFMVIWKEPKAGIITKIGFEDVKGFMTPLSKLKIAQVEEIYKIKIEILK